MNKKNNQYGIQLQIDFLLPYELTPTKEDIMYEFLLTGNFSAPFTIIEFKKNRKKIKNMSYKMFKI